MILWETMKMEGKTDKHSFWQGSPQAVLFVGQAHNSQQYVSASELWHISK